MQSPLRGAVVAALALAASPALAGSMTLSVTTAQGTATRTITVPDAHLARVATVYRTLLALDPGATNAAVFEALAQSVFRGIRDNVLSVERSEAETTAKAGVTPVDMQ